MYIGQQHHLSSSGEESFHLHFKNEMTETYTTIILLVALHGCENWSLTCREAHRL